MEIGNIIPLLEMWRRGRKTESAASGQSVGTGDRMDMCVSVLWATPTVREQRAGEEPRE